MKFHKNLKCTTLAVAFTLFASNIYAKIPNNWDYFQVGKNTYVNLEKELSKNKISLNLVGDNDYWKVAILSPGDEGFGKFDLFELRFNPEDILYIATAKYMDEKGKLFNSFKKSLDDLRVTTNNISKIDESERYAYSFKDYTIKIERYSDAVKVEIVNEKLYLDASQRKSSIGLRQATESVNKFYGKS